MGESDIRKFRLIFEEIVSEGTCKGLVFARYRTYPIIIASTIPRFDDEEIRKIQHHIIEEALKDFTTEALESYDRMECLKLVENI